MPEKTTFEALCDLAANPLGLLFVIFPAIGLFCWIGTYILTIMWPLIYWCCCPILAILAELGLYKIPDDDDDDDDY